MLFPRSTGSLMLLYGWFAIVVCLAQLGCSRPVAPTPEIVRPLKTIVVSAGEDMRSRVFSGKVDAANRVQLAFQVPGVIVKLPVKEGQKVAKGELIAQLRPDEFEARLTALQGQLDQARAALRALQAGDRPEERLRRESQVRSAEARLANVRIEFDRMSRLIKSRAVSQSDYDRTATEYQIAKEELKSVRQLLEIGAIGREEDIDAAAGAVRGLEGRVVEASLQLQDTTLRAPYDGVIAQRFVEDGQNVQAKAPVVKFQDVDEIEVVVDVPESIMAADLRASDIVQLTAEFSAFPGVRFPVQVKEIAQRADPTTQTFAVRVGMQSPPDVNLLPGMTGSVTLTYRRASVLGSRILVPISAIYKQAGGQQVVWVLGKEDGKESVSARSVKLGAAIGGEVEILQGLEPGERIAIAGVTQLREGMKVRDLGDEL